MCRRVRGVFGLGTCAVLVALAACKGSLLPRGGSGGDREAPVLLQAPPEIRSQNGVLTATLRVAYAENQLGGDRVYLRSYNGGLVGPTLRARPGDVLDVAYQNDLPPAPDSSVGHDHGSGSTDTYTEPHAFNDTNFHTHGLWTDPEGSEKEGWGDNVLLDIKPGQTFKFKIHIPPDHPAGTHWYHPHHHGSVALQVSSGMEGMLIVEGGLDDVPEIRNATEQVMVFQQISYDSGDCGHALPAELQGKGVGCIESYSNFGVGAWQRLGRHTTINGQVTPTVTMRPGEVQRWRLLDAGVRESVHLALVPEDAQGRLHPALPRTAEGRLDMKALISGGVKFVPLHLVAEDGIAYGRIDERNDFELEPGYRADALVKISEPGRYRLVDLPSGLQDALQPAGEELSTLAYVVVEGEPHDMPLPPPASLAALAPYRHVEDAEITGCQKVEFNAGLKTYTINGKAFDDDAPACKVPLGKAQQWKVSAKNANHPFHIHVNPFEVQRGGGEPNVWKDTWLVRSSDHAPAALRTRYRRYTGTFVLHCHILDHEDQGMMEKVQVMENPPAMGTADTRCVPCDQ